MNRAQVLRPITAPDVPDVLRLNAEHVELLSPLDAGRLEDLLGWSCRADVVVCDEETAGFVLVVGPGTGYDSPNYRWFSERFGADFDYLDRIVISDRFRRRGLASAVYDAVEDTARPRGRLVLEVNIDPPNDASLAFHRSRGFTDAGRRGEPGHQVLLMTKELPPG